MTKSGNSYTATWLILLLALFSLPPVIVTAQSPAETLSFARGQIEAGNYTLANKALHRLMFFDNGIQHPETFELLADSYFHLNNYSLAWNFYDLASIRTDNDSSRADFVIMKTSCRLYEKLYNEALIDLLSFQGDLTNDQQWQFNLLAGMASFYLDDFETARNYLLKCAEASVTQVIDSGFTVIGHLEKRYNPKLARVMSIIFPGSGQIYAGDLKNGLNSFGLIAGLAATATALSASILFIDAAIIIFPWFQRYYMGGYQKAYAITLDKQKNRKNEVFAHLIMTLTAQGSQ